MYFVSFNLTLPSAATLCVQKQRLSGCHITKLPIGRSGFPAQAQVVFSMENSLTSGHSITMRANTPYSQEMGIYLPRSVPVGTRKKAQELYVNQFMDILGAG